MSFRRWTVFAQDPSITKPDGKPLLARIRAPAERLSPGPRGHRVQVIDYDAPSGVFLPPRLGRVEEDPYDQNALTTAQLVGDPHFHQQNVYAVVMATLGEFERALGRPLDWAFASKTQQLKVAPHGIAEPNAFYSREDEALVFGYAPSLENPREMVYSCLSHDVIAHETTHAILDGLRPEYMRPSSPDQAALHEGFADIVAILSVFRHQDIVQHLLDPAAKRRTIPLGELTVPKLKELALLSLAEQMGEQIWPGRGQALRNSANIKPSAAILARPEYQHPHRRGEVLVAAVLHAFLQVWHKRIVSMQDVDQSRPESRCNTARVAEEGSKAAGHLLQVAIRALDYSPPIDITFSDYLSALLTADHELVPDDRMYGYRDILRNTFAKFGIVPAKTSAAGGYWKQQSQRTDHDLTHFFQIQREPSEIFKFIWQNAQVLAVDVDAFTAVDAVKPLIRVGPDGITLRETVATYVQIIDVIAYQLGDYGIEKPPDMPGNLSVRLQGGATLIFDEFGQLKFSIGTSVRSRMQTQRIASLWEHGYYDAELRRATRPFAKMHRDRSRGAVDIAKEVW
jgi:hypothetical protein